MRLGSVLLYTGTLARGQRYAAHATRLWIRFRAATNVDVRVDGSPATIPAGTVDAVVTSRGLARAA